MGGVCNSCGNTNSDLRHKDYSGNDLQIRKSEMKNSIVDGVPKEKKRKNKKERKNDITRESIDSVLTV